MKPSKNTKATAGAMLCYIAIADDSGGLRHALHWLHSQAGQGQAGSRRVAARRAFFALQQQQLTATADRHNLPANVYM